MAPVRIVAVQNPGNDQGSQCHGSSQIEKNRVSRPGDMVHPLRYMMIHGHMQWQIEMDCTGVRILAIITNLREL